MGRCDYAVGQAWRGLKARTRGWGRARTGRFLHTCRAGDKLPGSSWASGLCRHRRLPPGLFSHCSDARASMVACLA